MAGTLETTVPMYIVHSILYKEAFSEELCTENIAHRRHCTKKSFVPRISACATKLLWHENCLMLLRQFVKLGSLNFRVGAKFHLYIGKKKRVIRPGTGLQATVYTGSSCT